MNNSVVCPSCKGDVVFDVSDGASYCPACGARFELAAEPVYRKRFRWFHPLVFVGWMFLPAVIALLFLAATSAAKPQQTFDKFTNDHATLLIGWLAFAGLSCVWACAWFMGRFTERFWVKMLVGLFLGAGIFFCNVVIALFGSCAFLRLVM